MTARLALHPYRRTERPHREAKTAMRGTTHMQHAITVPRACVRRKDPADGVGVKDPIGAQLWIPRKPGRHGPSGGCLCWTEGGFWLDADDGLGWAEPVFGAGVVSG